MRLIHNVVDDLRGLPDEQVTPLGAAIEELLGGERGSLADLVGRFNQAGLGHVLASWTGEGPRESISARDLRRLLGEGRVEDLATLAGLSSGDFIVHLIRLLPGAVHRMAAEATETPAESPPLRQP